MSIPMRDERRPRVAVVDYGMGNLYSVLRACRAVEVDAFVTGDPDDLGSADAIILPGVGAFRDAMHALDSSGLAAELRVVASSGTPVLGVCLGLQLLMSESSEFGVSRGLDIVPGVVERLSGRDGSGTLLKVPQVGWNELREPAPGSWRDSPLAHMEQGESMYFVHSYHVRPSDPEVVLSRTRYGDDEFCSTLRAGSILGCQYHPELSGRRGLDLYRAFFTSLTATQS